MRLAFPLLAIPLLLAGCATPSPESRVRSALVKAGLDQAVAGCMAERLVRHLSMGQLRKLASLNKLRNADVRTMTVDEFFHQTRALGDPEILSVVTKAGIRCSIAA